MMLLVHFMRLGKKRKTQKTIVCGPRILEIQDRNFNFLVAHTTLRTRSHTNTIQDGCVQNSQTQTRLKLIKSKKLAVHA